MNVPKRRMLSILTLLFAIGLASCGGDPQPGQVPRPVGPNDPVPDPAPRPKSFSWALHPDGDGYDLDVVVDGRGHHADHGGEYMHAHTVSRSKNGLPPSAVSAFEVAMPDGEAKLYWIEPHGSNYAVYSRFWDPFENRHHSPQRVALVRL